MRLTRHPKCRPGFLSILWYTQNFQDHGQRAKFGKTILKKVYADKCSKEKPVFVDEKGVVATVNTKCHAEKNKKSGNGVNPVCNYHFFLPLCCRWELMLFHCSLI